MSYSLYDNLKFDHADPFYKFTNNIVNKFEDNDNRN